MEGDGRPNSLCRKRQKSDIGTRPSRDLRSPSLSRNLFVIPETLLCIFSPRCASVRHLRTRVSVGVRHPRTHVNTVACHGTETESRFEPSVRETQLSLLGRITKLKMSFRSDHHMKRFSLTVCASQPNVGAGRKVGDATLPTGGPVRTSPVRRRKGCR